MLSKCSRAALPALRVALSAGALTVGLMGAAIAGPYEDASAAFKQGDYVGMLRILRPLADRGEAKAQANVAFMYEKGHGVPQNYAEAIKWYRKAADQGDATAQVGLGLMYELGEGVPQNYSEAANWYRKAADQGSALGQTKLAAVYAGGRGVPRSDTEAMNLYRKAADQGDPRAQVSIGNMFYDGQGVSKSFVEAVKWYRKAADLGFPLAQYMLGAMYVRGEGVPPDMAEAAKWFRRAADQGDALGQVQLGNLYATGAGVPQNYVLADLWFNRAAVSEPSGEIHDSAISNLRFIAGKMTPAQIAEAKAIWQQCVRSEYKNCVPSASSAPPPSPPQVARRDDAAVSPPSEANKAGAPVTADQADAERRKRAGFPPASDRAGTAARCVVIVKGEVENTSKCLTDSYVALIGNKSESAAVLTDAIVGRCRVVEAARMNDRYFPFCDGVGYTREDFTKRRETYFARARDAVLSQIVEARTQPVQPQSPPSKVARREDKGTSPSAAPDEVSSVGSGFFVSGSGHIVTNAHVVAGCRTMRTPHGGTLRKLFVDEESDLALYIGSEKPEAFARLHGGRGARPGEPVMAVGFPFGRALSIDPTVTTGIISALSGMKNDRRQIQITAPVQPGNSGGPVLSENGSVVGVVVTKLDAIAVADEIGDIPQNVNFAVSLGTLQSFLDAQGVPYVLDDSPVTKKSADIAAEAMRYTVFLECLGESTDQTVAAPTPTAPRTAAPAAPASPRPTPRPQRQAGTPGAPRTPPPGAPQAR